MKKKYKAQTRNIMRWEYRQALWNKRKGMAVGILIGGGIVLLAYIISVW